MTVINTNVGALNARVAALSAQTNMEKAMQRLSGMRITQQLMMRLVWLLRRKWKVSFVALTWQSEI